ALASVLSFGACQNKGHESRDAFRAARTLVTQGQYEQSVQALEGYLARWPQGKHASRATLFLGKANAALGDWEAAQSAWQSTAELFPKSPEAHKARYKLAMTALWRGDPDSALRQFKSLAAEPDGPLAPEATAMARYLSEQ
ncbi:MAG: tetratricopeptide repeat protein, partial [Myxococcota bacterium]